MSTATPSQFRKMLLTWFDQHGRKHFPWQIDKTPYRVWVSEIMLQQTQVSTVIPYYERFMTRFPDLTSLANAPEDDVLHLWAGLGYYSRARNLHRAAKSVLAHHAGKFPDTLETIQSLPGIGQSTAGAILAIAFQQRAAILDGNVKRVLARYLGVLEPVNQKSVEAQLWEAATRFTPAKRIDDYTQAIMDLGATVCTRGKPKCGACPLQATCAALAQDIVDLLPRKTAARALPTKTTTFLVIRRCETIWLRKRPPSGIWGGLFSLPELPGQATAASIREFCQNTFQARVKKQALLPAFRHTFTHYHLELHPVIVDIAPLTAGKIMDDAEQIWYNLHQPKKVGLPKPIQTLLRSLE